MEANEIRKVLKKYCDTHKGNKYTFYGSDDNPVGVSVFMKEFKKGFTPEEIGAPPGYYPHTITVSDTKLCIKTEGDCEYNCTDVVSIDNIKAIKIYKTVDIDLVCMSEHFGPVPRYVNVTDKCSCEK